jgi:DNA end-binding protein Ku
MAARPTWKGVLQISAVQIAIKVYPATESSATISFNQLHGECQTRMQQKRWCPKCAREVPNAEIVKGFEFEKGRYVILLEDELDAVQPPSTRVIDLVQFADAVELEPYAIDRSYYLAPGGPTAAEAFSVLRIALRHRVGIGKLAIYGREYLVAVRPTLVPAPATYQSVLMLHTLHHAEEIRFADTIDGCTSAAPAPAGQVRLFQQLIASLMQPLDLADFTDQYQTDVRALIDAKIVGEEIVVALPIATPAVLSLREALEQSLAAVSATKKRPAKPKASPPFPSNREVREGDLPKRTRA